MECSFELVFILAQTFLFVKTFLNFFQKFWLLFVHAANIINDKHNPHSKNKRNNNIHYKYSIFIISLNRYKTMRDRVIETHLFFIDILCAENLRPPKFIPHCLLMRIGVEPMLQPLVYNM